MVNSFLLAGRILLTKDAGILGRVGEQLQGALQLTILLERMLGHATLVAVAQDQVVGNRLRYLLAVGLEVGLRIVLQLRL